MSPRLRAVTRAVLVASVGVVLLLVPVTDRVEIVIDPTDGGRTAAVRMLALLPALVQATAGDGGVPYTAPYVAVSVLITGAAAVWTYRRACRPQVRRQPADRLWP